MFQILKPPPSMDPTEEELEQQEIQTPSFPMGRVKKIVKMDQEIKKLNSEALYLISISADLFLASVAEGARGAAINKKRKIIKLDHIRFAVRAHRPTSDFLLDCLPNPAQPPPQAQRVKTAAPEMPLSPGARRIDNFFRKPAEAAEAAAG